MGGGEGGGARSSHISDLQSYTVVATLPGAWRYRVRARTGWPGVSTLQWPPCQAPHGTGSVLGPTGRCQYTRTASLACMFHLRLTARPAAHVDLSGSGLTYCWPAKHPTNLPTALLSAASGCELFLAKDCPTHDVAECFH